MGGVTADGSMFFTFSVFLVRIFCILKIDADSDSDSISFDVPISHPPPFAYYIRASDVRHASTIDFLLPSVVRLPL